MEPGSDELNVNAGVAFPDGSEGLESIVVSGAVRSIVKVELAGLPSVLPAGSVGRWSMGWLPSGTAEFVCGLVQELQPPPSTRHSKLEPGSLALNANVGVVSFVGLDGLESSVVF